MTWAKYPICTRVSLIFVDIGKIKISYNITSERPDCSWKFNKQIVGNRFYKYCRVSVPVND